MHRWNIYSELSLLSKSASFHRNLEKNIEIHEIIYYFLHGLFYPEVRKRQNKVIGLHEGKRVRNSLIVQEISMIVTLLIIVITFFLNLFEFDGKVTAIDLTEPLIMIVRKLFSVYGEKRYEAFVLLADEWIIRVDVVGVFEGVISIGVECAWVAVFVAESIAGPTHGCCLNNYWVGYNNIEIVIGIA